MTLKCILVYPDYYTSPSSQLKSWVHADGGECFHFHWRTSPALHRQDMLRLILGVCAFYRQHLRSCIILMMEMRWAIAVRLCVKLIETFS